ncbi:MAG: peptide MFS transporter, partial [Oligoflexia bacterium]|nr:peptide MFS transporter [Oligoflexia bacterium]
MSGISASQTSSSFSGSATYKNFGELWGHPKGLFILFFTEMWERFSYYGMRAILVYYMMKQLLFTQEKASQIYGIYTGLVYLTPFFGGMLADRVIGQRRAVVLGGILMATGQFLMAFENTFYLALFFLIMGNGAFKPNISTQVGSLYESIDSRRDRAFSIFYVGINLGAFFSPLICGTLGELYGWRYGFGAAGVGMLTGLMFYLWGQRYLAPDRIMEIKRNNAANKLSKAKTDQLGKSNNSDKSEKLTSEEKSGIGAFFVICMLVVVFWGVYEQQGNTLALWADSQTDRHLFGGDWVMPASWFQS